MKFYDLIPVPGSLLDQRVFFRADYASKYYTSKYIYQKQLFCHLNGLFEHIVRHHNCFYFFNIPKRVPYHQPLIKLELT
jgi:hypothetical protein